jgi:dTDP-4-dehydrorhamnose reductase
MRKLMITGANGLVGTNIIPQLSHIFQIVPITEQEWDIRDRKTGEKMLCAHRPDVLLNLAAITDVDGCEDKEDLAYSVNVAGAGILAELCNNEGVRFVHFSTDYVFDGTKNSYTEVDETHPLSVYGKTKLLGEKEVLRNCPSSLIIRTEWIYGKGGISFIEKVRTIGLEKGTVSVVNDQKGSPTYSMDLAVPLAVLLQQNRAGIYNVTNNGSCTWFDFARAIFSILGMDVVCLPISSSQSRRKAQRPDCSVLDCSKLKNHTGLILRDWREALKEYLTSPL